VTTSPPGRGHRPAVLADLVRTFEAHFAEHRECDGLAGSIVEVIENADTLSTLNPLELEW